MVHAQARDALEDTQDLLAATETDRHDRGGTHFVTGRADGDQVRGDPAQLHHEDADEGRALGDVLFDAEELLDAEAVGGLLEEGSHVVHTRAVCDALGPRAVLHVLLDAGVQVAGVDAGLADLLAVKLEDETQNAVGRGVDRAEVDDDALGGDGLDLVQDVVPVAALGEDLGNILEGQVGRASGRVESGGHQFTLLRISAEALTAPLNSTGMPPSG